MVRHSSRIELSQAALKQNVNFIRKKIGPDAIFSSVVKADAFGHGIGTFVPMAEKAGIRHFSVASSYEAWEVNEARTKESTIMIMGILYDDDMEWVISNEIEFFVFDLPRLKKAKATAEKIGKKAIIHLEVETGGNRTGLEESKLDEALEISKAIRNGFNLKGCVLILQVLSPFLTSSEFKSSCRNLMISANRQKKMAWNPTSAIQPARPRLSRFPKQ